MSRRAASGAVVGEMRKKLAGALGGGALCFRGSSVAVPLHNPTLVIEVDII